MFIDFDSEINTEEELSNYLLEKNIKLPDYRCAVIALMLDSDGRIILQRRGPKSRDEVGMLEDIGGAYEETDITFRNAMEREILEEVGDDLVYSIDSLVGGCLVTKFDSRSNKDVNWLFLLYKCSYISGEFKINEVGKCLGYEVYSYDKLPISEVAKTTLDFWKYYYNKKV